MLEVGEIYCKICGDTYDPMFGCRCAVTQSPRITVRNRLDFMVNGAWLFLGGIPQSY